jgi:hypothetical protein
VEESGASVAWIDRSGVVDANISGGSTLFYHPPVTWGNVSATGGSRLSAYP